MYELGVHPFWLLVLTFKTYAMLLGKIIVEMISGTFKRTQTVTYSNGKVVKRILGKTGTVPEEIIVLKRGE